MLWYWLMPLIYLLIAIPFGIAEARHDLKDRLKNISQGWYLGDGSPRLSEENRIRFLASQTFWPGIGYGLLWPLHCILFVVGTVWDLGAYIISSKELKVARKEAEEAKTRKILEDYHRQQKKDFEDLEE